MSEHGGDIYDLSEVLDFSVNVNPLGIPEPVLEAAKASIENCTQYPDVKYRRLRRYIARHERVSADKLICGNGAADLIFRLAFVKKPKQAVVLAPTFSEYEEALKTVDCAVTYHTLKAEEDFMLDDSLLKVLTPQTDMLFLCNPNNPTGQTISKSMLFRILNHCEAHEIFLVIDECFLDFLPKKDSLTLSLETASKMNLFVLKAFTKTYAMAGLRLGYGLCADEELLEKMSACTQPWAISIPAQEAGVAALRYCEEYVDKARKVIEKERDYLTEKLTKNGMRVFPSKANFLLFYSENTELQEDLLNKGILVRSCANFHGLDEHYFRIAVKMHKENKQLIQAIKEIRKKAK